MRLTQFPLVDDLSVEADVDILIEVVPSEDRGQPYHLQVPVDVCACSSRAASHNLCTDHSMICTDCIIVLCHHILLGVCQTLLITRVAIEQTGHVLPSITIRAHLQA